MTRTEPMIADVVVPVAVDVAYSYRVPPGLELAAGDFVTVPLGTREAVGVVWGIHPGVGPKLKEIISKNELLPLLAPLRAFLDWLAHWTLSPRGMVLRMATRAPFGEIEAPRLGVRASGVQPERLTAARSRVLAAVAGGLVHSKSALAQEAGCSTGVIDALVDAGALEVVVLPPEPLALAPKPAFFQPHFDQAQHAAADLLVDAVKTRKFSTVLLEGVTGSGKTEVYFEAVAEALRQGGQVLLLLPEIALTAQFLDRFAKRFGQRPAEWHSGVSSRRRRRLWCEVAQGDLAVVAGVRSGLFLPFKNLRLIVVDEEHDPAYKQEDGVAYHARDMAVMRARFEQAAIVLASATPSLESRANAQAGRFAHARLEGRYRARPMPDLAIIDLRRFTPERGKFLSQPLIGAVEATLARGEQALLFLNRRGYAPLTLCRSCGHRFQCPDCTAWLVEHRFRRALMCHHCGHVERRPDVCPECGQADTLTPCGPGVERLAEEAAERFPGRRQIVLSSDLPGGAERLREEITAIAEGAFDLIIGTQLVAKGHHFPLLTLVGVVDSDLGLNTGDPRAGERTFQVLQQVTGRAGRGELPGRGLMQSWQPEHPVMQALLSGDSERFYDLEMENRRLARLPPFGRLAAMLVSGPNPAETQTQARALARAAHEVMPQKGWPIAPVGQFPQPDEIAVLGPAEAPIAVIRGRHRFRLLVKTPRNLDLQKFLRELLAVAPKEKGGVRVFVDIDPHSFF